MDLVLSLDLVLSRSEMEQVKAENVTQEDRLDSLIGACHLSCTEAPPCPAVPPMEWP